MTVLLNESFILLTRCFVRYYELFYYNTNLWIRQKTKHLPYVKLYDRFQSQ